MSKEMMVSMTCTEGGSNKQYTIWLERRGSLWVTVAAWGPIGGHITTGLKTKVPVSRAAAEKEHAKVVKAKKRKGYVESGRAVQYAMPPAPRPRAGAKPVVARMPKKEAGLRPMLLTVATEDDLEYFITNNKWAAQEKMNGKRIMVRAKGGKVLAANRSGQECPVPQAVIDALTGVEGEYDGELVRGRLHLFDAMRNGTGDLRGKGMALRHEYADAVAFSAPTVISIVPLVTGTAAKRALVEKLKADRKEGVVFKKVDAPYEPGRRTNLKKAIAVKVKFYAEASLKVIRWNNKQSIQLGARDGRTTVFVGNMTVPEKYNGTIHEGDIVRVRYLYATEANKLYQPNLDPDGNGDVVRDDILDADALSSLKHEGIED